MKIDKESVCKQTYRVYPKTVSNYPKQTGECVQGGEQSQDIFFSFWSNCGYNFLLDLSYIFYDGKNKLLKFSPKVIPAEK